MYPMLFVHPDQKLVKLYEQQLKNHFVFDSAHDGLSAIRKIRLIRPKIIVSSYHLPRLSGTSLLQFVRNHPELSPVPFIFLTEGGDIESALQHGASEWMEQSESTPDILTEKAWNHLKLNVHLLK
jgi:CheY-like chemotaxis protein